MKLSSTKETAAADSDSVSLSGALQKRFACRSGDVKLFGGLRTPFEVSLSLCGLWIPAFAGMTNIFNFIVIPVEDPVVLSGAFS